MHLATKQNIAFICVFTIITLSVFADSIIFLIPIPIIIILVLRYKQNFILFAIIVSFITLTGKIDSNLRLVLQIVNYTILILLFLYQYGLDIKQYPKVPPILSVFILSLFLLMFISSLASDYTILGLTQMLRLILFLGLVYGLFSFIKSSNEVKLYIYSLIIISFIYFIVLQIQLLGINYDLAVFYAYQVQMGQEFLHKNFLGAFFSIVILMLLSISFFKPYRPKRLLIYFILAVLFLCVLLTNARASILCLSLGVAFIFYNQNKPLFWGSVLTLILLSVIVFISPIWEVVESYSRLDNIGTGREYLIQAAMEVIKNNYFLGIGPGAIKYEMYANLPFLLGSVEELMIHRSVVTGYLGQAHSFYLFYFGDLGFGGLILAFTFPIVFFRLCYSVFKRLNSVESEVYYIVLGITSVGIFMFIRGFFEPQNILSYGGISFDLPFWILISIMSFYYMKFKDA